jgi:enolase-phosphatase E1
MLRSGLHSGETQPGLTLSDTIAMPGIYAVVLDIEGTTTPVDFVHRTLFSYARAQMAEFLKQNWQEPLTRADVGELRRQQATDAGQNLQPPAWNEGPGEEQRQSALAYINWLMDRDTKSTPLKSLQGRIWQQGYANGDLHGEVYADVPPAFDRWSRQKKTICIFSSGSVLAQKLLFSATPGGDLTPFIRSYFDTTTGPKREPASYGKIAAAVGVSPANVLFISDIPQELDAARGAAMQTALCVRPGGAEPANGHHPVIRNFDSVFP